MTDRMILDDVSTDMGSVHWMVRGRANGRVLHLTEPLSFWGGFDAESGRIIDQRHPEVGRSLSGCVLVMAAGRGSSSASSVIAEAVRLGTAPAAILMTSPDEIVALGAIVADELYGTVMPVAVVGSAAFERLTRSVRVELSAPD